MINSDTGILGETVRITRKGYANGALGLIVGMYSTRHGASFSVKISHGERTWTQSLKREEFTICKPWNVLQPQNRNLGGL